MFFLNKEPSTREINYVTPLRHLAARTRGSKEGLCLCSTLTVRREAMFLWWSPLWLLEGGVEDDSKRDNKYWVEERKRKERRSDRK